MKDEALKLALEALEQLDGIDTETECVTIDVGDVIDAIKEALSQPEQEPVAWEQFYPDIGKLQLTHPPQGIYYTPPQRKPLTDEQINQIADEFIVNYRIPAGSHYDFAKAIEAAHNIKE